jgi:hypothetical protein
MWKIIYELGIEKAYPHIYFNFKIPPTYLIRPYIQHNTRKGHY